MNRSRLRDLTFAARGAFWGHDLRHARRLAAPLLAGACAACVAACGTPSPDLFVVDRDGTVPGAKLHLLVSDTSVRCNDEPARPLTSAQTIEARDITDDLLAVQAGTVDVPPAPPAQIFRYRIRDAKGLLQFADTAQRPPILPRTALFVRRVAIDTCRLVR
ncbi:MAG: hypothetical protein QOJ35_727 [Solirubrobacteraceae bacterium]|jgi:hypothetical protein|nr:hypothetical protein [Solirubrobacteraceae bacterium]